MNGMTAAAAGSERGDGAVGADAVHCAGLLRRGDRDRWLSALFAPEGPRRNALLALYAWNLEVARIPDTVREPLLAQMRLQWWRETLEGIQAGAPRAQPIARELHRAVTVAGLPAAAFEEILQARERDLDGQAPADMAALETFAAATGGALAALAAQCLAGADAAPALAAARDAGTAFALAGLMRALPWNVARRRIHLPEAELRAAGVVAENLVHRSNPPELYRVIEQVCARGAARLEAARRGFHALPRGVRRAVFPAFLPAALAAQDLARLRRAGFDPERPQVHAPPLLRQARLLRAALLGRP